MTDEPEENVQDARCQVEKSMDAVRQAVRSAYRGLWLRAARDVAAGRYDPDYWRECLASAVKLSVEEGRDVEIPVEAASVFQRLLSGDMPKRSRKKTSDFVERELAIVEINALRTSGLTREEAIGQMSHKYGFAEATLNTWIDRYG